MFDILLEITGAVLTAFIFFILFSGTKDSLLAEQKGIKYIVFGFGLLLFSAALDITDNFPSLNYLIIIGDTEWQAFFEKAIGQTLGLFFVFRGVLLWLPSIKEIVSTRQLLRNLNTELDQRVQERSRELEQSNQHLELEIIERKKAEKKLKYQASHDTLTGIPNRFALIELIKQEVVRIQEQKSVSSILFLDLDNFKQINDLYGHSIGDSVLKLVAKRLNELSLPDTEFVGRLAGDEFVIIMSQLGNNLSSAKELANNKAVTVMNALRQPMVLTETQLKISVSIGVKLFSYDKNESVHDLLRQADIAMYHIKEKEKKKGGISFFHQNMQNVVRERACMSQEITEALEQNQFYLHYQPQVSSTGDIFGFEALLRWQHPTRGLVRPDEFIPTAEDTGLIDKIGRYVLHRALTESSLLVTDKTSQTKIKIAVNISPSHFLQVDFVEQVKKIMSGYDLNHCQLVLEITESVVIQDFDDILEKMQLLHQLGVGISLDDFGTGYSSLSYIKKLPFDTLKIDRSFINDINKNSCDEAIVDAILAMASSLGVSVIAEGVETEEQKQFLEHRGCARYQGYLFARPAPLAEFLPCDLPKRL